MSVLGVIVFFGLVYLSVIIIENFIKKSENGEIFINTKGKMFVLNIQGGSRN